MAVVMTAPAAFALTFEASPERHLRAAELLGGAQAAGPDALPDVLRGLMRDVGRTTWSRAPSSSSDSWPRPRST
jgi:hypothetical protein